MDTDVLTIQEPSKGIAVITLNRPEKRNALSARLKDELTQTALNLAERTDIGAVILTGSGGYFTAGNDISESDSFAKGLSLTEARRHIRLGLNMCEAWEQLPQLSIAAIEGFCIGGGISLAVACDFRILQHKAWMRAPEVDLGITFSWGTLPRLVRLVGPQRAKMIAAVARKVDSKPALSWGLCEDVVENPLKSAIELAEEIISKPRVAQQMIKESINRITSAPNVGKMEQDQVLLNMTDPDTISRQKKVLKGLAKK